jgi:hypothetical protein
MDDDFDFDSDTWDMLVKESELSEEFIENNKYKMDWKLMCQHQKLSEDFIENNENIVDWELICKHQKLSEKFIEKHGNKLGRELVCEYQELSEEFIERYQLVVDWKLVCKHQQLSEEFIERHNLDVYWTLIFQHQKLSEEFIKNHKDKVDLALVCQYQKLSDGFIEKYWNDIDLKLIYQFQQLSEQFINRHKDEVDWDLMSQYQKLPEHVIEKYCHKVNWTLACQYQQLSDEFIKKFIRLVDWSGLSYNDNVSDKVKEIAKDKNKSVMDHECCCCFGTYHRDQIAKCNNKHIICKDCINSGTKAAVDDMKLFKCPNGHGCDQFIDESIINKFVSDDGIIKAYSNTAININTKGMDGLHKCKYCNYAVIMEGEPSVFFCELCKKEYCFTCNEKLHEGQKCKQEFHDEAEELTREHTVKCCGNIIVRGDGCNKLTCNKCGNLWCWYCKTILYGNYVYHFRGSGLSPFGSDPREKCPMYGDPPEPSVIKSDKSIGKKEDPNQLFYKYNHPTSQPRDDFSRSTTQPIQFGVPQPFGVPQSQLFGVPSSQLQQSGVTQSGLFRSSTQTRFPPGHFHSNVQSRFPPGSVVFD